MQSITSQIAHLVNRLCIKATTVTVHKKGLVYDLVDPMLIGLYTWLLRRVKRLPIRGAWSSERMTSPM